MKDLEFHATSSSNWPSNLMIHPNDDPVTVWLHQLEEGAPDAAALIWDHFFTRLHTNAKRKIGHAQGRVYDEDDAVQSAFNSFCDGLNSGRYSDLENRSGLWKLLVTIVSRKISHRHAYEHRLKRDIKRTVDEKKHSRGADSTFHLETNVSIQSDAEINVEFDDALDNIFKVLDKKHMKCICFLKLEGFRDDEIASQLGCSPRTVQRKIELIRKIWYELYAE